MLFPVPDRIRSVRDEVHAFMTERVEPAEPVLNAGTGRATPCSGSAARPSRPGSGRSAIPPNWAGKGCRSWTTCT